MGKRQIRASRFQPHTSNCPLSDGKRSFKCEVPGADRALPTSHFKLYTFFMPVASPHHTTMPNLGKGSGDPTPGIFF